MKKACIMDIDGTLFLDFKKVYLDIMKSIFGKSKIVMRLNALLYKINDLDVISNTMFIFKSVILLYSILSFSNYFENIESYKKQYVAKAKNEVIKNYNEIIRPMERLEFEVFLISHNTYTHNFKEFIPINVITPKNKRKYVPKNMSSYNIVYMIGNNYFDDILTSFLLNKKYRHQKKDYFSVPIYIGCSTIMKKLLKNKALIFNNLNDMLEYILKDKSYN